MDRGKIGFVVGLTAEARLLQGCGFMVGVGGGTPAGAAGQAASLVDRGVRALVSFGLAGGLNPGLGAGDVVVPGAVVEAGAHYACDGVLLAWLGGVNSALLLAGAEIAVTAADKAALFARTGADAVDLESGAVAQVAAARSVGFAVLRAVCDPADKNLPPAALVALNEGGRIGMLRVLASVARRPGQVPGLIGLGRDAARARTALLRRVRALGPL